MPLGDVARDVKPETHAVRVACACFAPTERWLKDALAIGLGNARAVVDDFERPRFTPSVEELENPIRWQTWPFC